MSEVPESLENESPAIRPSRMKVVARYALALAIAALGGTVFYLLGLPLPFMLGAMSFCAVAAIAGAPVTSPLPIRPPMAAIIGAMLGAGFTTAVLADMVRWAVPLMGLVLFMLASVLVSVTYLRRVAGYDARTAYFAGMPGGLADMAIIGEAAGGDMRKIAMTHATRILIVVFTVPFFVRYVSGVELPAVRPDSVSILDVEPVVFLWLVGTCVGGVLLAHLLRMPAKYILGPMLVSAVIHALGWTDYKLPYELVIVAQIVLGAGIGCRFAGLRPREIGSMIVAGVGSTVLLLLITAAFAYGVDAVSGLNPLSLFLAYSPGGLMEMGLVAIAIGIDTAFVAAHHIVRIALVGLFAPLTFRLLPVAQAPDAAD